MVPDRRRRSGRYQALGRQDDENGPADGKRQERDRHADPRVLPEADGDTLLARGLNDDQVGDGAQDREVAREGGPMARMSQARCGSPKPGTTVFNRSTAGTFDTRFERKAVASVRTAGR
jgi:hypothetical protein